MRKVSTKHVNRAADGKETSIFPTLQEEFDLCRGKVEGKPLVIAGISGNRGMEKRMQIVVGRQGTPLISRTRS